MPSWCHLFGCWCVFFSVHHSASLLGCSLPESLAPEKSWMRMTAISTDLFLPQSEWKGIFCLLVCLLNPVMFIWKTIHYKWQNGWTAKWAVRAAGVSEQVVVDCRLWVFSISFCCFKLQKWFASLEENMPSPHPFYITISTSGHAVSKSSPFILS